MGEKRSVAEEEINSSVDNSVKAMKLNEAQSNPSSETPSNVLAQFWSESDEAAGPPIELPLNLPKEKLQLILNTFLKEEPTPYNFFVEDQEVKKDLQSTLSSLVVSEERILKIIYQPQAVFKVRAVTRCTASLPGHSEAVLHASFSPDGQFLASGSGDTTVRFWDIYTETPHFTSTGHKHWVLVTSWSPDGSKLASACKSGRIIIWDPTTGKQLGKNLMGHKQWVNALSWEPLHLTQDDPSGLLSSRLASAGKDGDIRIWNTKLTSQEMVLSGHTKSVTTLRWGGEGLIYSGSQDRTIKVWRGSDGVLCRTLSGHGHWVNTLALNTDYVLRTGAIDPKNLIRDPGSISKTNNPKLAALARYRAAIACGGGQERVISGSDDFTLFLWEPAKDKQPIARLTGHQQLVNDVKFSPDTRTVASASFDKSIRLWSGITGKFIAVLRGHVQGVYQIAWSADSRLLVSGSKDSTLKVWNVESKKIEVDLPGHADEVYTVDWSPDGEKVVSGGKDKVLKIWRR